MATLGDPWTVIGDGTSGDSGRPPLATWYDQSNGLFIGLLNESSCNYDSQGSHVESQSVDARFQTYSLPAVNHGTCTAASSCLIQRDDPIVVELPAKLLGGKDTVVRTTKSSVTPRQDDLIMLTKLSLDQRYLAMQFSDTMVRIAKIDNEDSDRRADIPGEHLISDGDAAAAAISKHRRQWTIDLTASSGEEPILSDPGTMPRLEMFGGGAGAVARAAGFHARKFLNRRSTGSNETDGNATSARSVILPGGMLWVDCRADCHPILILVTSRSVLLYKISPKKHLMRRFASFSVPTPIDCFWYEHQARCLMVGSLCRLFEDGENVETFDMRAWSFRRQLREGDGSSDQTQRSNDACSMTTEYEKFTVGKKLDGAFSFESISLVSLYGNVFCLAIGEKSVTYIKLDASEGRVSRVTDVPYPNPTDAFALDVKKAFISVVDNTIIIIDRSSKTCLILDENESNMPFSTWCPADDFDGHDMSSFLPPSGLLDSSGRGRFYGISLDLQLIAKSLPPTAAVVSFLLRRGSECEKVSLRLAFEVINRVFNDKDSSFLLLTFVDILSAYGNEDSMDSWDNAACLPLVHQAALLSSDVITVPVSIEPSLTDRTLSFLSQTAMLQYVLIPQARSAIAQRDIVQLNRLCEFSLLYLQSLEQRKLLRTPALECYTCALLWRLGNGEEILSLMRARHQWQQAHRRHSAWSKEDVLGQEALAEMLIAIVTNESCCTCKDDGKGSDRISRLVIAYAIDLLNNIRSFQVAGKHLLALGRCGDAITITQKAIGPKSCPQQQQDATPIKGAVAYDFFCAAINEAKSLESIGDRCRLLFNVHSFISDYDPDCMTMAPCDSGELQSALASKFGPFPSELFGGHDNSSSISLRAMFGFSIAHTRAQAVDRNLTV
jgi:hypothetical protein